MKIVKEDMGYEHQCKTPCGLVGLTVQCIHCPYSVVEGLEESDLIVLRYTDGGYTEIVELTDLKDKCFSLDISSGTWTYNARGDSGYIEKRTYKIGKDTRHCSWGCHWGVIGLYDRTDVKQLTSMLWESRYATE